MTLLYVLACSSPEAPSTTDAPVASGPVAGDTLVTALPFDPGNLNPLVAPYALSGVYIEATQLGLVEREVTEEGLGWRPALAKSWSWSEDGKSLTYELNSDLVWSDGTPMTMEDLLFTHELIADPAVASNWHSDAEQIERIEVVDEDTVTFHFVNAGNKLLLQGTTFREWVPKHVLGSADRGTIRGHAYSRQPLASGAWRVDHWTADEKLVLVPNEKSPVRPKARLDRIISKIVPEYATRLIELQNGAVDLVTNLEVHDIADLKADYPQIRLVRTEADGMQYLGWNLQRAPFDDLSVRRALTQAIDADKLMRALYEADGELYAQPCVGTIGPNLGGYVADIDPLAFDPAAARAAFEAAGFADGDGDGVLDRDGKPFTFSVLVQNGYPTLESLAVRIQAMLADVGVKMEIQMLEPNRFSQLAREHDFDAILWGFGNNPKIDPYIKWHSEGQYNWMGYADPETDALIEQYRAEPDLEKGKLLVQEVQRRVYDAQPATFLFWEDGVTGVHERFEDVEFNTFTFLFKAEEWWVPEGKQKY